MMDDAHGIGVMGENGRGTAEYYNCLGQVDIITGTFSKSFRCVGGFVTASEKLTQYLRYYADSNVFSAAMTPLVAASSLKALELIQTRPEIRKKLWANVNYLRKRLTEEGFDIGCSVSAIFPIMVRDNRKVYEIARELQKKMYLCKRYDIPCDKNQGSTASGQRVGFPRNNTVGTIGNRSYGNQKINTFLNGRRRKQTKKTQKDKR